MLLQQNQHIPNHRTLLDWAFELHSRAPLNWSVSAQQLARAAAMLHLRGQEARQMYATTGPHDGSGLIVPRPRLPTSQNDLLLDVQLHNVSLMLLGMAVEDLTKGIILERDPATVDEGTLLEVVTSHDLVALVRLCQVPVEGAEVLALRVLAEYVRWAGRYPSPQSAQQGTRVTTDGDHIDYVFDFGQRLLRERLWPQLNAEHSTDDAAARSRPPRDRRVAQERVSDRRGGSDRRLRDRRLQSLTEFVQWHAGRDRRHPERRRSGLDRRQLMERRAAPREVSSELR